jgi:hypothetical protein
MLKIILLLFLNLANADTSPGNRYGEGLEDWDEAMIYRDFGSYCRYKEASSCSYLLAERPKVAEQIIRTFKLVYPFLKEEKIKKLMALP